VCEVELYMNIRVERSSRIQVKSQKDARERPGLLFSGLALKNLPTPFGRKTVAATDCAKLFWLANIITALAWSNGKRRRNEPNVLIIRNRTCIASIQTQMNAVTPVIRLSSPSWLDWLILTRRRKASADNANIWSIAFRHGTLIMSRNLLLIVNNLPT